jgi:hypothetical protein
MGNYKESEVGLRFGNAYWKLLKFVVNEATKDLYLVFPIPDVGLKLSIHSPKPPLLPTPHAHWNSHKLGIHEDVDADIFSESNFEELAVGFLESFRYCQPSGDEDVIVIPNFLVDALQTQIIGNKERTIMDVGKVFQTMCEGIFYQTKARKLPQLIRHMGRRNPNLDLRNDPSIYALDEKRMIIPLSSKTMIEFDHQTIMAKLRQIGFNSFFSPVERTMERISRTNPNAFQGWLPSSEIKDFFEHQITIFNKCKPTIVAF